MQRKIKCIETNQIYNSVSEAGRALNIDKGAISRVCTGKQKQAKGYTFEFVNDRNDAKNNNNNNVVQQLENVQSKVNIIYSLLTKDNENNNNVVITPHHQDQFRNVLTQPTIDLLSLTNMELVNALANDIQAYRERVKAELRKMAGTKNNPIIEQPQQHQEDETGWDAYERELEEKANNNSVMVDNSTQVSKEKPQEEQQAEPANNPIIEEKPKPQPQPKNPYLQDEEEEECWDFIDDKEDEEYRAWKKEHLDLFTEREQREFLEEEKENQEPQLTLEERREMWTNWTETGTLDGHKEEVTKEEPHFPPFFKC